MRAPLQHHTPWSLCDVGLKYLFLPVRVICGSAAIRVQSHAKPNYPRLLFRSGACSNSDASTPST